MGFSSIGSISWLALPMLPVVHSQGFIRWPLSLTPPRPVYFNFGPCFVVHAPCRFLFKCAHSARQTLSVSFAPLARRLLSSVASSWSPPLEASRLSAWSGRSGSAVLTFSPVISPPGAQPPASSAPFLLAVFFRFRWASFRQERLPSSPNSF